MNKGKILFYTTFLSCFFSNIVFAQDNPSVEISEKAFQNEKIITENLTLDNSISQNKIENNYFANFLIKTNQKQLEVQKKEEQGYRTSTEKDRIESPGRLKYLEAEKNTTPIYDLKGSIETKAPDKKKDSFAQSWWNGDYATGDWLAVRSKLEERGITIEPSLLYSPMGKTRGGLNNARAIKGYKLFNLAVTLDTEKMGFWKGGTFYMLYQHKKGMGLSSEYMGDYQVLDGWDFREMNQLSEAWYQQDLFNDKLKLKFGKQDANTDFCAIENGFDFLNTSFSIMPTVPLPTYPEQTFGFMANVSPKEWLSLKNGVYHKNGGAFNISEIEFKPEINSLPGKYLTGCWIYSSPFNTISGIDADGIPISRTFFKNFGWYSAFEQMVYKENKNGEENPQGLALFGQIGLTPSNRNDLNKYLGVGLHYKGLIPKRDNDVAGLGMAMANFSTRYVDINNVNGQETSIECFYKINVNKWFYLQPDVQFITNPGGTNPGSVAIGLRSMVRF